MSAADTRRGWLKGAAAGAAGLWLTACNKVNDNPQVQATLKSAEGLTRQAQRLLISRKALAQEFTEADISSDFRPNGSISPGDAEYRKLLMGGFADYRLVVDGLVDKPLSLTLAQVRALTSRTQITRHDCVEGWSSIGKWKGARLGPLLDLAGLKADARYIVFHCADSLGGGGANGRYYESIDLIDAYHPQTIMAYEMNGAVLPVAHGAPLRLRVERQLGYKHAKYVMRIEAVADFAHLGAGKGGFWEDRGYEWYAGI
ncbi:molybdopterin-binding protein [Phenylobacterium sp.]|uniref:molybdopterin-binding protein n=1 Tax=Phenylobacterium sp. TaxID=1871053 RepID=UPI0027174894|nr:molybdopterin-binding protein [Phenylobacterium sp.]MDO8802781.1 molybdopterin-binding protein [Phenylobacterium sp.]